MSEPIKLLIQITSQGISVTRYDALITEPGLSVEQQAINPKLGVLCAGRSFDDAIRAIQDCVKEAVQP